MDFTELKIAMVKKEMNIPALAVEMGVSKKLLYSRMKGETPFTQCEITRIAKILGLDQGDIIRIFFNQQVS